MLSLVRVDNRLIHGQVVEAWLPYVKAERVAVADDEAAGSMLIRAAMGLAVGESVEVLIQPVAELDYAALAKDGKRTALLFRDVSGVWAARAKGLPLTGLNLGNVHFSSGRRRITTSVYLSQGEVEQLSELGRQGVAIEARAVPSEKPLELAEIAQRFSTAAPS